MMVYNIILGRNEADRQKFGTLGTIFLGKQYIQMGQVTALSHPIYLDVTRSHVVFVCGKRGGGKSYTMGVIAEGISDLPTEIKQNISIIMMDTMGVYWTMKYPNLKDEDILSEWKLKSKGLDITVFTPAGYFNQYKAEGIPTDYPFSIKPSELAPEDWFLTFDLNPNEPVAVLIERVVLDLKSRGENFDIQDLLAAIRSDGRSEKNVKDAAENRFLACLNWGVFSKEGTPLSELAKGGRVTILDMSVYATQPGGWKIKALVLGIVAMRVFIDRMVARKTEEFEQIKSTVHYLTEESKAKKQKPMVWLVVDEAHEFMPLEGKTSASEGLITILREGRQPGVSLILATQQPGKIHTDVMTQSDILIAHHLTAKIDVDALGKLMQSYLREGLDFAVNSLPKVKGAALAVDDTNERMYPMKVRPRFTWHGGEAPTAMPPPGSEKPQL